VAGQRQVVLKQTPVVMVKDLGLETTRVAEDSEAELPIIHLLEMANQTARLLVVAAALVAPTVIPVVTQEVLQVEAVLVLETDKALALEIQVDLE